MSSWFDLAELGKAYKNDCTNFDNTYVSGMFAVIDLWPMFLFFYMLAKTSGHPQVFTLIILKGSALNVTINWALRILINQKGPEPDCSADEQMPAYCTSFLTFLCFTILFCCSHLYYVPLTLMNTVLVWCGSCAAIYARIWLRFNTGPQLLAGIGTGLLQAICYCLFVKYILTYRRILKWFLYGESFFVVCEDNMINKKGQVVCTPYKPKEMLIRTNNLLYNSNEFVGF